MLARASQLRLPCYAGREVTPACLSSPRRHLLADRAPGFAHATEPRHALPFSAERAKQPWCPATPPLDPLVARRRPQRASARSVPPRPLPLATCPWNSSSSSSRVSSSSPRRHDALTLQGGGSPTNLSGRRKPTSLRYIRRPPNPFEQGGNLRPPSWHPPQPEIVGRRPSSPSPATAATATAPAIPAPPEPPPLHSLHQKLPLPLVNPSPCSILIGTHCGRKITLPDDHRPPRSSPPAAPSTPETISTT